MPKLGQAPAFPPSDYVLNNCGEINFNPMGMSKRFYAACAAMQGILTNVNQSFGTPNVNDESMQDAIERQKRLNSNIAKRCYEFADELLKQEQNA